VTLQQPAERPFKRLSPLTPLVRSFSVAGVTPFLLENRSNDTTATATSVAMSNF